jgi:hypothetical protein
MSATVTVTLGWEPPCGMCDGLDREDRPACADCGGLGVGPEVVLTVTCALHPAERETESAPECEVYWPAQGNDGRAYEEHDLPENVRQSIRENAWEEAARKNISDIDDDPVWGRKREPRPKEE